MKRILPLVALLAAWSLVLTWCNKTENVESVDDGSAVENPVYTNTSLDMWWIISATEKNFPKSYTFSKYNIKENKSLWEGSHKYNRMDLWYLTPENTRIVDREVISSWIEDWMIYTLVKATLDDDSQIEVLYINDPETLKFVAASVDDGTITTNYQFSYDEISSLSFEEIEWVAEDNFPTDSTYTKYDIETNETFTWEIVYPQDTPHNLANITPDFPPVKEHKLNSSAIEDWMIYSHFDVVFDDDTTGNILYINNPELLNFVAATVEVWTTSVNYQFNY